MDKTYLLSLLAPPQATRQRVRRPARPGLGDGWFTGRGATFMNVVLPVGFVVLASWGAWRLGKYAVTGRSDPGYTGVPHASKVWD